MSLSQQLPELRIATLGGLRIALDGAPTPGFISRKVEALLVYLACTRRDHPREALGELLWDDLTQERTMGNLRTALSDLQKHLAPYLAVTRYSVGIAPDAPIRVDLLTLNRALDQADRTLQLNEMLNASTAEALADALALFNGDFLRGFAIKSARGFEGWYLLEAERVRGRVIEAYGRLAEYAMSKRLFKQGIDYAARTLKLDPVWEPAHRALMRLLALSGQRSQAIAQYETCCRLLEEELAMEPEEETVALYEEIVAGELTAQSEPRAAPSLALPDSPFVARPMLQSRIDEMLHRAEVRLLSLVGPGGSGKTRLAMDAAVRHAALFPDGVAFVPLERVAHAADAVGSIVSVLQIGTREHSLERRLIEYLYGREMLLVLDTVEHIEGISEVVERLLTTARSLRILVTSQVRLNIRAEYIVSVGGMAVPEPEAADAANYPSITLYARHAERIAGEFDLPSVLQDVAALCAFVDGNPLAIELAAAWSRLMSPGQILNEIRRSGDFLTSQASDTPERHRSMRAVFEWMWARFSRDDRTLAAGLAVFRGDFSPEVAAAVTSASPAMLTALADHSLIMVGGGRCRVHGLLRGFLSEKLDEQPDLRDAVYDAHAEYFCKWARGLAPALINHTANDSVARFVRESDNAAGAWEHALTRRNVVWLDALAEAYFAFDTAMNRYTEGLAVLSAALKAVGPDDARLTARLNTYIGILNVALSRYDEAHKQLETGIAGLDLRDSAHLLRMAHAAAGAAAYATGDYDRARFEFEQALDTARVIDDLRGAANALFRLGDIQSVHGDYGAAKSLLEEGLSLGQDAASPYDRVRYSNLLADVACKIGDFEAAHKHAEDALSAATVIGSRVQRGVALATLGRAAYGRGAYRESRDYLRRSVAQAEEIENRWGKAFAQAYLARTCWQMNELAAARFHLDQAQAIAQDIQSAWLMAFIQRLRALPMIERAGSPVLMLGIALNLARSLRAVPLALDALAGTAAALLEAGEPAEAAPLALVASIDPMSEADARVVAARVLAALPDAEIEPLTREAAFERAISLAAHFQPHVA